ARRRPRGEHPPMNTVGPPIYGAAAAAPTQPARPRYWYGWQMLTVDGISVTAGLAIGFSGLAVHDGGAKWSQTAPVGFSIGGAGLLFGGPIVHWTHGNIGKGFGSLGMRLGLALLFGAVGFGVGCREGCHGEDAVFGLGGFLIGLPVGASIGGALDAGLLAYGT